MQHFGLARLDGRIQNIGLQLETPVGKIGLNDPRADGIDPDSGAGQFFGHDLCEHDNPGLGHGIGTVKQGRHLCRSRSHVNDAAATVGHQGHDCFGDPKYAMQVDIESFHPGLFIISMNRIGHAKDGAGVVA